MKGQRLKTETKPKHIVSTRENLLSTRLWPTCNYDPFGPATRRTFLISLIPQLPSEIIFFQKEDYKLSKILNIH